MLRGRGQTPCYGTPPALNLQTVPLGTITHLYRTLDIHVGLFSVQMERIGPETIAHTHITNQDNGDDGYSDGEVANCSNPMILCIVHNRRFHVFANGTASGWG